MIVPIIENSAKMLTCNKLIYRMTHKTHKKKLKKADNCSFLCFDTFFSLFVDLI